MAMEFGVLKNNFVVLNVLVERLETRMRDYEARAQNISMAYLIWERAFFFSTSHTSSSLNCTHWWLVFSLNLSSSFLYFLFFMRAVILFYWTHNQMGIICEKQNQICQRILEIRTVVDVGLSMEAGDSRDGFEFHLRMLHYDSFKFVQRKVYLCSILFALLAATAFESYACIYLLCN